MLCEQYYSDRSQGAEGKKGGKNYTHKHTTHRRTNTQHTTGEAINHLSPSFTKERRTGIAGLDEWWVRIGGGSVPHDDHTHTCTYTHTRKILQGLPAHLVGQNVQHRFDQTRCNEVIVIFLYSLFSVVDVRLSFPLFTCRRGFSVRPRRLQDCGLFISTNLLTSRLRP